jgi:beta-lactam-binding protein with PASTA domain
MKDLIDFFKNQTVQKHIIYAFGGLFILLILIFLALTVYTRHGQALSVPEFIGMSMDEARKIADQKQMHCVVTDSEFIQSQEPGTILTQNPSPGTKVKVNRSIFVTINSINPEKVPMPNVVGVSVRQAEAVLHSNGLRLGYKRYFPDVAKDYVLQQLYRGREIARGTKIIKGSSIDLVLGLGLGLSKEKITVPDLKQLTRLEAQEVLSSNYLNFDAMIYDNSVETYQDSLKAVIWKQNPAYGSTINVGSSITVWLTKGNETSNQTDSIK